MACLMFFDDQKKNDKNTNLEILVRALYSVKCGARKQIEEDAMILKTHKKDKT